MTITIPLLNGDEITINQLANGTTEFELQYRPEKKHMPGWPLPRCEKLLFTIPKEQADKLSKFLST